MLVLKAPGLRAQLGPVLIAAPFFARLALLPQTAMACCALVAIIVLGVPHGALDGELAREILQPRCGRAWFLTFAVPYLALATTVLVAWRVAPLATLVAFLGASVWHFGTEDAPRASRFEQVVLGGLPVAMPALAHPDATARLFAVVIGQPFVALPCWWQVGAVLWALAASAFACAAVLRGRINMLFIPALLVFSFALLPPLAAFALYFIGVHAPAHTRDLIADRARGRRIHDWRNAIVLALPIFALTLLLGALLWPFYAGPTPERLLALTIQGLAALTLPHMLLDQLLSWPNSSRSCCSSRLC